MNVTLEFSGLARVITGVHELQLQVADDTTYNQVVCQLGELYPGLKGIMLNNEGDGLINATLFAVNGESYVMPVEMERSPKDGDRLTFVTFIVGG
jgi:molybdopterin converting factor small subunit